MNTPLRRSGMARVLNGSQFYLHTLHSSAKGMNHTCLCLPSRSWYSFTDPGGMDSWVGLGWLVGYIPKQLSSTGNWSRTRSPISEVIMFHCGSDERPTTHLKHCLNLLINGLVSSRTSVCMCIIQCVCVCVWCLDADGVKKRLSHFSHDVLLHRHLYANLC